MKKYFPYALAVILGTALVMLFLSSRKKASKTLDERLSLKRQDKIPYGSWAAYKSLESLFPDASISVNRYEPGYWDSLSNYEDKQVLFILTPRFLADNAELRRMMTFVENGNHVFISTQYLSSAADEFFNVSSAAYNMFMIQITDLKKGMKVKLDPPHFDSTRRYEYPGRAFESYFTRVDTPTTDVLGRDAHDRANLIRLQAGKGFIYVHLEPFAFTNYFLLYGNNIEYYENLMSLLPADARKVVWDEYYISQRPSNRSEKKHWFSVLMGMENEEGNHSFRAAFLLLIAMLLLYVFMEMRRKQRIIPVMTRPRNDSLDFVKTVGRLYYDKADHKNLSRKMSAYFLEHVRNKYKIATNDLNEDFARNLSYKSGVDEKEIGQILAFIKYAEDAYHVSDRELMEFHRQLESFYLKA